jgi:hypothetical protein
MMKAGYPNNQQQQQQGGNFMTNQLPPFKREAPKHKPNPSIPSFIFRYFSQDYDDKVWYYIDLQKKVQGPFSGKMMDEWYYNGHLPLELHVTMGKNNGYRSLKELAEMIVNRSLSEEQTANQEMQANKNNFQSQQQTQSTNVNEILKNRPDLAKLMAEQQKQQEIAKMMAEQQKQQISTKGSLDQYTSKGGSLDQFGSKTSLDQDPNYSQYTGSYNKIPSQGFIGTSENVQTKSYPYGYNQQQQQQQPGVSYQGFYQGDTNMKMTYHQQQQLLQQQREQQLLQQQKLASQQLQGQQLQGQVKKTYPTQVTNPNYQGGIQQQTYQMGGSTTTTTQNPNVGTSNIGSYGMQTTQSTKTQQQQQQQQQLQQLQQQMQMQQLQQQYQQATNSSQNMNMEGTPNDIASQLKDMLGLMKVQQQMDSQKQVIPPRIDTSDFPSLNEASHN